MIKLDQLAINLMTCFHQTSRTGCISCGMQWYQLCMCVTISAMVATNCEMCPIKRQHQSSYYQSRIKQLSLPSSLQLDSQSQSLTPIIHKNKLANSIIHGHAMAMHFCALFTLNDISQKISSFTILRRNATKGHDNDIPICFHFLSLSFKFPQIIAL